MTWEYRSEKRTPGKNISHTSVIEYLTLSFGRVCYTTGRVSATNVPPALLCFEPLYYGSCEYTLLSGSTRDLFEELFNVFLSNNRVSVPKKQ